MQADSLDRVIADAKDQEMVFSETEKQIIQIFIKENAVFQDESPNYV